MTEPAEKSGGQFRAGTLRACAYTGCGNVFVVKKSWIYQRFCSNGCAYRSQIKRPRRAIPLVVTCSNCGNHFDNWGEAKAKYCSDACRDEAREKAKFKYACLSCGEDTGRYNRLYCSDLCRASGRATHFARREKRPSAPRKARQRATPRPQDALLLGRVLLIGTKAAGAEIGISKSAVNGRLWRSGLSSKGAPAPRRGPSVKSAVMIPHPGMLSARQITRRGWSARLIKTLLGDPDQISRKPDAPHYKPAKLWSVERVKEAESRAVFIAYREKYAARSKAIRESVTVKKRLRQILGGGNQWARKKS